jgi:hypothetical protein
MLGSERDSERDSLGQESPCAKTPRTRKVTTLPQLSRSTGSPLRATRFCHAGRFPIHVGGSGLRPVRLRSCERRLAGRPAAARFLGPLAWLQLAGGRRLRPMRRARKLQHRPAGAAAGTPPVAAREPERPRRLLAVREPAWRLGDCPVIGSHASRIARSRCTADLDAVRPRREPNGEPATAGNQR